MIFREANAGVDPSPPESLPSQLPLGLDVRLAGGGGAVLCFLLAQRYFFFSFFFSSRFPEKVTSPKKGALIRNHATKAWPEVNLAHVHASSDGLTLVGRPVYTLRYIESISPLGVFASFPFYKTQEDITHILL